MMMKDYTVDRMLNQLEIQYNKALEDYVCAEMDIILSEDPVCNFTDAVNRDKAIMKEAEAEMEKLYPIIQGMRLFKHEQAEAQRAKMKNLVEALRKGERE